MQKEKAAIDQGLEKPPEAPEPKLKMGAISANGSIGIEFNVDMIAPPVINQKYYQKTFKFGMQSDGDGSVKYGAVMKKSEAEKRLRRLKEHGLIETPAAEALQFSVEVKKHTSRVLVMEMNFA